MVKASFLFLMSLFVFYGCSNSIPNLEQRKQTAFEIIKGTNTTAKILHTSNFDLFSYTNISKECKSMKVYIEGDGLSWISRSVVSDDPTPLNPLALQFMDMDSSSCKIYIARPCQYIKSAICEEKYWTSHRFNDKVIQSFNEALDNLKSEYKNDTFELVGYSGGGAVALLSAATRDDISSIVTIAGNLDTDKWTDIHNISPLKGSLNPANVTYKLAKIPQYHLIGNDDTIIPKEVFLSYKGKFRDKDNINHILYNTTHTKGWIEAYKEYLQKGK